MEKPPITLDAKGLYQIVIEVEISTILVRQAPSKGQVFWEWSGRLLQWWRSVYLGFIEDEGHAVPNEGQTFISLSARDRRISQGCLLRRRPFIACKLVASSAA